MSRYDRMTKAELLVVIKQLEKRAGGSKAERGSTPERDAERERLMHELEVHETELESQNEELRYTRSLLEESRDRYADLYDFAPVSYLTLDERGFIRGINLTGAALLGAERARILGMPLTRYTAQDDIPKLREYLGQCWDKKESVSTDLHLNVPEHPGLQVQLVSIVRSEARGPIIRMTILDNTERKQAEARMRDLNVDLERRSQELEGANRELELAHDEIGALVYSVSHDLHGPIVQIEQLANALAEDYGTELQEEERQIIGLIRANARDANRLAKALLVLARTDQQVPRRQLIEMRGLVEQVVNDLRREEPERQVEIVMDELPPAHVDPGLFRQVWLNLLSNAWKFTSKQAAARIEIGACKENGVTIYSCKDNGAGFDMSNASRLFRAFQRLHHAEEFPGEGLGLAIVQRIIRRHGGRVWAEANVGEGATFYFTIGD